MLEREAELRGDPLRLREQLRGARLREVNHLAVVAEVLLRQLRMAVDTEPPDHQPLEMTHRKSVR